jgi:integrase
MRVSEILGLQLTDFKDDGFIHIKRTRTKGMIGNGKTRNAIRKVPYSDMMLEEVKKFHREDSEFIFGDRDDASKLRRYWKKILDDSGVRRHKLYSTRHTFATTMLKEGRVSINELAGLLGHSSPKITLERYASIINVENIDLGKNFSLFSDTAVTIEENKTE